MSNQYNDLHNQHLGDKELRVLNAAKCLKLIRPYLPFSSVIDFGCGIGGWLIAAKQLGATNVLGIEGAWIKNSTGLLNDTELHIADLTCETISFTQLYDLALSIEVGEHLPATAADLLCDNLVASANFIVFSAAVPGQGGINHINEQKPKYWVDRFWNRGFVPLEIIRPSIIREPRMYAWLQQNLIAFINYDCLRLNSSLLQFALPRQHFYMRYASM